ncbi:hypothetical protein IPH67_05105 [bacterium]|nr:MAG: hypothetical protein IPH67_05105 [bacterium]
MQKQKKKVKAARTATQKSSASDLSEALSSVFGDASTGELDFKDQPPFEDDLPF